MRDADTMSAALTAAETGHLVLSSLHTNDTSQTISRILDMFPEGHQSQMRQQLSLALLAIITQQLVPAADGSDRYPAVEAACREYFRVSTFREEPATCDSDRR